jgi:hypothetical protein
MMHQQESSSQNCAIISWQDTKFTLFTSCVLSPIQQAYLPIGKNSIKRGFQPRQPYAARPLLVAYVGFKVVVEGMLKVPLGNRQYFDIPLNDYVKHILSDPS